MTEIKLRDYQREAIDAVFKAWADGMRRPAIVLPTGAGKTVVFSALVDRFRRRQSGPLDTLKVNPALGSRVMILAHRDELVDQAISKLRAVMPGVNIGKVKAQDNDVYADVMVCSVQTLSAQRRRDELIAAQSAWRGAPGPVGLIITDECHHAAAASYKKIYDAFPDALQLGVTATMARGDRVGLGDVWDDVVYKRSILWMISRGYLTDVRTRQIDLSALDLGAVKASRGDWQAGALGEALMDAHADTAIARAYKEHAGKRQGIVFTPTVETAWAACQALNSAGVRSAVVDGATHRDDRRHVYEEYRTGRTQVLVNCMVLTEGFDMPQAEVAVIARPTQSAPLYTQMVGRVLRPWPGKTEALVLDLVGASANKLRTLIDLEPGAVQAVREGESLAEAVVREEEEELNESTCANRDHWYHRAPCCDKPCRSCGESGACFVHNTDQPGIREQHFCGSSSCVKFGESPWPVQFGEECKPSHHSKKWNPRTSLAFELKARDVSSFGTSDFAWVRTPKGVMFINCGETRVFLWPSAEAGLWDVCVARPREQWHQTEHTRLEIGMATAWAETVAEDHTEWMGFGVKKSAAWRRKPASEKQRNLAAALGAQVPEKATQGDAGYLIDSAVGGRFFDRFVK